MGYHISIIFPGEAHLNYITYMWVIFHYIHFILYKIPIFMKVTALDLFSPIHTLFKCVNAYMSLTASCPAASNKKYLCYHFPYQ